MAEHRQVPMTEQVEQWRLDEHDIEGGWCGCEYPRLWPPRCHCPECDRLRTAVTGGWGAGRGSMPVARD